MQHAAGRVERTGESQDALDGKKGACGGAMLAWISLFWRGLKPSGPSGSLDVIIPSQGGITRGQTVGLRTQPPATLVSPQVCQIPDTCLRNGPCISKSWPKGLCSNNQQHTLLKLRCKNTGESPTFPAESSDNVPLQLILQHFALPVAVRFPACPRVRLKTVDPPKGNGLGQIKTISRGYPTLTAVHI